MNTSFSRCIICVIYNISSKILRKLYHREFYWGQGVSWRPIQWAVCFLRTVLYYKIVFCLISMEAWSVFCLFSNFPEIESLLSDLQAMIDFNCCHMYQSKLLFIFTANRTLWGHSIASAHIIGSQALETHWFETTKNDINAEQSSKWINHLWWVIKFGIKLRGRKNMFTNLQDSSQGWCKDGQINNF